MPGLCKAMTTPPRKTIMRSLGEFCGHIVKAVKADPTRDKRTLRKTVEQEDRGNVTLRRTTVEEIEFRDQRS